MQEAWMISSRVNRHDRIGDHEGGGELRLS